MKGLVEVKFKKDCLKHLPDKRYREIECKPKQATLNAARIILAGASTTISGLTLLRELSDGFQYQDTPIGKKTCDVCKGNHLIEQPVPVVDQEELNKALEELMEKAESDHGIVLLDSSGIPIPEHLLLPEKYEMAMVPCWNCGGEGTVTEFSREAIQVPCPKEDALKDILDSHEEDGRLVVYAGFTGSIERVTQVCERMGWEWIRVDGRGWKGSQKLGNRGAVDYLKLFQRNQLEFPRVCFIGQPGAAGMGLTLTASSEIVYYSNDFNAESRIQSEDRIHRPSMDLNKGALITDLIHLPSDLQVLENLKKKRKLQDLSLGAFRDALGEERKF
jgi:SNF2 family DNA or RNA helicase